MSSSRLLGQSVIQRRGVLALGGGADGRLPLRDQLALLAAAHDVAPDELAKAAGPIVAHLVERGIVEPVTD